MGCGKTCAHICPKDSEFQCYKGEEFVTCHKSCMDTHEDEHQKKEVDPKDCYFDKECHAKVNWDKVGEMKELFFTTLKEMKSKGDKDIKPHWIRMHRGCVQAGMPEDRVDYMLKQWVEYVYPEVWNDPKDCYSDKECHAKVNWDKVGELKDQFFARLKHKKSEGNRDIKPLWMYFHKACVQAGMPEDRADYMLKQWVEYAYPEALQPEKDQCSKYQKWGDKAVEGCNSCAKWYEGRVDACMDCGKQCGNVCPNGDDECYKGEEFISCHKKCMVNNAPADKIDWDKVKKVKRGIMMRLKAMKAFKKQTDTPKFWERAHEALVQTGLPKEKVDWMLKKMAQDFEPNTPKSSDDQCSKYKEYGDQAVKGCEDCAKSYDGRADDCMSCGKECAHLCKEGDWECYKGEVFGACHKKCMNKDEKSPPAQNEECSQYKEKGDMAFRGCHSCAKYYPGQVEKCMNCERPCDHICPDKSWECYTGKEFGACHKQCMAPSEVIV
jgi:hypothetical protein